MNRRGGDMPREGREDHGHWEGSVGGANWLSSPTRRCGAPSGPLYSRNVGIQGSADGERFNAFGGSIGHSGRRSLSIARPVRRIATELVGRSPGEGEYPTIRVAGQPSGAGCRGGFAAVFHIKSNRSQRGSDPPFLRN